MKPTRFANQFYRFIFFEINIFQMDIFLINYIIYSHLHPITRMVLAGFIASLAVVNQFINPKAELSLIYLVLILVLPLLVWLSVCIS